jgi:hypothetical protein
MYEILAVAPCYARTGWSKVTQSITCFTVSYVQSVPVRFDCLLVDSWWILSAPSLVHARALAHLPRLVTRSSPNVASLVLVLHPQSFLSRLRHILLSLLTVYAYVVLVYSSSTITSPSSFVIVFHIRARVRGLALSSGYAGGDGGGGLWRSFCETAVTPHGANMQ